MFNLYDSVLCRICAEPNANGVRLNSTDSEGRLISSLVNKYLPLRVEDDGILPQTLCSRCHSQLQVIICFFGILIKGQNLLRKYQKHVASKDPTGGTHALGVRDNLTDDLNGLQTRLELYTGDHAIRKIVANAAGDIVKRKRGRPRKDETIRTTAYVSTIDSTLPDSLCPDSLIGVESVPALSEDISIPQKESEEFNNKRRRKKPSRYSEVFQGKELEQIFRENGVLEDNILSNDEGEGEEGSKEIIGQIQNGSGESMGVVVLCNNQINNPKKKLQFQCDTCHKIFHQENKFVEHVAIHKAEHLCGQCGESFNSVQMLNNHLHLTAHSASGVEMPSLVQLVAANDRIPTPDSPLESPSKSECPLCGMVFRFASSLKSHMKTSHNDEVGGFPCDVCGKKLKHPSSVVYHKEAEHCEDRKFVCAKCNAAFKHRRSLQKHQRVHSGARGLSCPECGKIFKSKGYLNVHIQLHSTGKKFACELCSQVYTNKSALMLHMRMHTGEKPFECYFCHKTFTQKGNLQEHMRIHTGEKPFKCDICCRAFTTSSQRRLHLKRHIGDKPNKCEICGKTFLHKDSLITHMRRHTGERPFHCEKCKKTFTELSAVKKHVRIHTGEKPYVCNVCGKAFADNSNLGKHKKTHKGFEGEKDIIVTGILSDGLIINAIEDGPCFCKVCGKAFANGVSLAKHKKIHLIKGDDEEIADQIEEDQFSSEKQIWAVVKQAIESENGKEDGTQQVIYITYNDPDDPDDPNSRVSEAILLDKDTVLKDIVKKDAQVVDNMEELTKKVEIAHQNELLCSTNDLVTSPTHLQSIADDNSPPSCFTTSTDFDSSPPLEGQVVMDEHGNPLRFTTPDGGIFQVTTIDGESLQLTGSDGSSMPVRITTADGETLTPSGLDISNIVSDVSVDPLVSAAVESLELVTTADVQLLTEDTLDFLPLS